MGLITTAFLVKNACRQEAAVCKSLGEPEVQQGSWIAGRSPVGRSRWGSREEGRHWDELLVCQTSSLSSFLFNCPFLHYFIVTTPTAIRFGTASKHLLQNKKERTRKEIDCLFPPLKLLGL